MARKHTPPSLEVVRPVLTPAALDVASISRALKNEGFEKKHFKFEPSPADTIPLVSAEEILGYLASLGITPHPAQIDTLAAHLDDILDESFNQRLEDTLTRVGIEKIHEGHGASVITLGGHTATYLADERAEVIAGVEHFFGRSGAYKWQARPLGEIALLRVHDKKHAKHVREIVERQLGGQVVSFVAGGIEIVDTINENELEQIKIANRELPLPFNAE